MPTAHTAPVLDGEVTSLGDYARLCARGFLYDCAGLPRRMEGSTDPSRLEQARQELARLEAMTPEEQKAHAQKLQQEKVERIEQAQAAARLEASRAAVMRSKIMAWNCPPELQALRRHMIEQLENEDGYFPESWAACLADVESWDLAEVFRFALQAAQNEVHCQEYQLKEEQKRIARINAWLAQVWEIGD